MIDPVFLAWIAGFFDGEGCVLVAKRKNSHFIQGIRYDVMASISQVVKTPLDEIQKTFGGSVTARKGYTGNVVWIWTIQGKRSLVFLKAIEPYCRVKKNQIVEALNYPFPNCKPLPQEVIVLREEIRQRLKQIRKDNLILWEARYA